MIECVICGKIHLDKDTIGINKKLLGTSIENFYCMNCLAEQEFKEEGCTLFT